MKNTQSFFAPLLGDDRGQSWVETVVMLPVIVALLLGLFYLHDLAATRMRAIQAARFIAWESVWYGREDNADRAMKTPDQLRQRLRQVGLGFGLKTVDVLKRPLPKFKSDQKNGVEPTFFLPCALSNLLPGGACGVEGGTDQSQGFISGIASSLSGVLNGLLGLAGDAAFSFQDLMAQNTNWDDEMNGSVYTAVVVYNYGYTGFFQSFGTAKVAQTASVLSHPYVLRRTNDDQEYDELLGDPCSNLIGNANGHVVKLWLFPSAVVPGIQGFGTDASQTANQIVGKLGDAGKCVVSAIGGLAGGLDKILGSNLGFKMPDGTLKEYPELNMPASSGVGSGNSSGGGLGGCQGGGGGAMGANSGFGGCP